MSAESKSAPVHHRESVIREQCTQCHRWSPPAILPKKAWLGKIQKMFALANDGMLASLGRPINKATVEEVVRYFETLSPKDLDTPPWLAAKNGRNLRFEHRALRKVAPGQGVPGTSNVRLMELFDDLPGPELVVCDMFSGWVSWADPDAPDSKLEGLARLSNPDHAEAVDLDQDGRMDLLVADLGEVMPSDKGRGLDRLAPAHGRPPVRVHPADRENRPRRRRAGRGPSTVTVTSISSPPSSAGSPSGESSTSKTSAYKTQKGAPPSGR